VEEAIAVEATGRQLTTMGVDGQGSVELEPVGF
jgi:hypothetical protein